MRVLQIIDSGGVYGAERVLLALMAELESHGVESTLASIGRIGEAEKPLEQKARELGASVHRVPMRAGADLKSAMRVVSYAQSHGYDVLHTHGYKANTLIGGLPRCARTLPVVSTLHGWTALRRFNKVRLYEAVERLALRQADRVVAVSSAMATTWRLNERFGERLKIIPNGVPLICHTEGPSELPEAWSSFLAGKHKVFAAGRLSPEKGFDVLIDALAKIRELGVNAALVLAGEGSCRSEIERQARDQSVSCSLLLPGFVEDASRLIRHFEVVAIPSRTEGLPMILLEAMLAETPVVATAVGEMPAVLDQCGGGGVIPPDDSTALANEIMRLLKTRRRTEEGKNVAQAVREKYSTEGMSVQYANTYRDLVPQ